MAMKNRIIAFVAGVVVTLGVGVAWGGLETGTYISDLVATNPLSSDLASTADDHLRLIKSTVKTTFPNINNAITVTDEQINAVSGSFPNVNGTVSSTDEELSLLTGKTGTVWTSANDGSASTLDADLLDGVSSAGFCQTAGSGCPGGVTGSANPTGTIGLSAVNGSATTFLRSDAAPPLSQAIAPTWSSAHIFSAAFSSGVGAINLSSSLPGLTMTETDGAANNQNYDWIVNGEQMLMRILSDDKTTQVNWMTVDRTGTALDRVTFPSTTDYSFLIGVAPSAPAANGPIFAANPNSSRSAAQFENTSATAPTVFIGSDQTGGNVYVHFYDGGDPTTVTGNITTNGTTTAYNTSSDAALKKNFKPSPSARKVIDCIQVESYDWKQGGLHVDHGFVAQRLNNCAPYAVTPGNVWQVDPSKLVPALIKYVQEQEARIAALERRLH